jgi:hypothetical protein
MSPEGDSPRVMFFMGSANQSFPSSNYVGKLDDIGVFNRALTPSEATFIQINPVSGGLVAGTPEPGSVALLAGLSISSGLFLKRRRK